MPELSQKCHWIVLPVSYLFLGTAFAVVNHGAIGRKADSDTDFRSLPKALANVRVIDLSAGIHLGETVVNQLTARLAEVNREHVSRFDAEQSCNGSGDLKPRSALVHIRMDSSSTDLSPSEAVPSKR
jgi:hypothetical protein